MIIALKIAAAAAVIVSVGTSGGVVADQIFYWSYNIIWLCCITINIDYYTSIDIHDD